jgi:hypothetical protein
MSQARKNAPLGRFLVSLSSLSFQLAILAILLFFHGCRVLRCNVIFHDFFAHVTQGAHKIAWRPEMATP